MYYFYLLKMLLFNYMPTLDQKSLQRFLFVVSEGQTTSFFQVSAPSSVVIIDSRLPSSALIFAPDYSII
jgi:hypothetical protein